MRGGAPQASTGLLLAWIGVGRAPLPLVLQCFCLAWGLGGCWANQWLVGDAPSPTPAQMLPSLGLALLGGVIGARAGAEVMGRLLPRDESAAVSRDGLYGLTGRVAFPVCATAGRIHIYDEFGTLHDEMCRVAPGQPPIEKGREALVMDRDAKGHLVVEEIAR